MTASGMGVDPRVGRGLSGVLQSLGQRRRRARATARQDGHRGIDRTAGGVCLGRSAAHRSPPMHDRAVRRTNVSNQDLDYKLAVFCDFENIALGVRDAKIARFDMKPVTERLLLKGRIVVKKAYYTWVRHKGIKKE